MTSPMTLDTYLQQQRQDFIDAFKHPAAYPVGVQDPAQTVGVFPPASTWNWDATVEGHKAFLRTVGGRAKEYWVTVSPDFDRRYREAFLAFLERERGVISASVPKALHADHVLNAAFARRHGLQYVRMALVWNTYNMSYGSKIEKNLTRADAHGKRMYLIDYIIFAKVLNIAPPVNYDDYRRRRREIARSIASTGVEAEELALRGMDGFFELWRVI